MESVNCIYLLVEVSGFTVLYILIAADAYVASENQPLDKTQYFTVLCASQSQECLSHPSPIMATVGAFVRALVILKWSIMGHLMASLFQRQYHQFLLSL